MELRVWVDNTQRIVCGVRLDTTCEQIVIALAHATKQSGRFTMVERWRNNERLLSPNEQPLVTLQRWGEYMSEVEFILRKTTTTLHSASPVPSNNINRQRYNTEDSQQQQQQMQLHRQSLNLQHNQTTLQNQLQHQLQRPLSISNYTSHQQVMNNQQMSLMRLPQNGYQQQHIRTNEDLLSLNGHPESNSTPSSLGTQPLTNQIQSQQQAHNQIPNNYPYEDLYSTIKKKAINQNTPPAIPVKPRLIHQNNSVQNGLNHMPNMQQANHYQQIQSAQTSNARLRIPSIYSDYMEALAPNRSNQYVNSHLHLHSNNAQNHLNHHQQQQTPPLFGQIPYNLVRSQSSISMPNNYNKPNLNEPSLHSSLISDRDLIQSPIVDFVPRLNEIEKSSTTNNIDLKTTNHLEPKNNVNEPTSNNEKDSVSQLAHNMLKVIEEQKKVLMNQKNELKRLDSDQNILNGHQDSQYSELICKIEEEIMQLEELSKENLDQIKKFEEQDFERELANLKSEQIKIESDIEKQKNKLVKFEDDIVVCFTKIQQLETELTFLKDDTDNFMLDETENSGAACSRAIEPSVKEVPADAISDKETKISNDSSSQSDNSTNNTKSCDDIDSDDESCNDASDDCGTQSTDSKPRSPKFVDKRGLINGIRSLKIDRQTKKIDRLVHDDHGRSNNLYCAKINKSGNDIVELVENSTETNRVSMKKQDKAARNSEYEFLMNL